MSIGNKPVNPCNESISRYEYKEHLGLTFRELLIINIAGNYGIEQAEERYDEARADRIVYFADAIIRKLNEESK